MEAPVRYVTTEDVVENRPVHAVWEITLACNLKCHHCGSRAGKRRPGELSTKECQDIVRQLARLGTREVTLIGGEAYLRRDWITIVAAIREAGMMCTLQTGGLGLTQRRIREAADAGLQAAGVSLDGLRKLHDELRGVPGSFDAATRSLCALNEHGIVTSINTQITSRVMPQLQGLMRHAIALGIKNWQVQLTVAMGRAADNPDLLLQPYQMLELMPLLAELYKEAAAQNVLLQAGNNVGYFGPFESQLRGSGSDRVHWTSCTAGRNAIGIEADGTIKGCPSLATAKYAGGNIRDMSLGDIWSLTPELSFSRTRSRDEMWGLCRNCYYSDVCMSGCTWTSDSLLGRRGNNPYCHHRALELERRGYRESIVQVERAPGHSFDHGRFELALETLEGDALTRRQKTELRQSWKRAGEGARPSTAAARDKAGRKLPFLRPCRGCSRHVYPDTRICPHCGGNVSDLENSYHEKMVVARRARDKLLALLEEPSR